VNLFPSAVEDICAPFPGLTNEYVLVIDDSMVDRQDRLLTGIKLRVEQTSEADAGLGERLAHRLREKLHVRFHLEVVAPGTLPRTVHKAKRVIHE